MKEYKFALMCALLFTFALLVPLVDATVTIVTPANSATIAGASVALNASFSAFSNVTNCTWYAKSTLTANSSWSQIGFFANFTQHQSSYLNGTFNSRVLEDASNYIFNATCVNLTNTKQDGVSTESITVDNTVPQAPTLSPASNLDTPQTSSATQTFTGTVTDANTTSCTYTIARNAAPSGSQDYFAGDATYSGSTCTFTKEFSRSADNGNWYWSITASDGTNTTRSESNFLVSLPGSSGGGGGQTGIDEETGEQCSLAGQACAGVAGLDCCNGLNCRVSSTDSDALGVCEVPKKSDAWVFPIVLIIILVFIVVLALLRKK